MWNAPFNITGIRPAMWNASLDFIGILFLIHEPFTRQPHKMVKHTQTIRRQQRTNCLSVFDHFVGLARKRLGL